MLGLFPVSADAISGEGAAPSLGVSGTGLVGSVTPDISISVALTGVSATASEGTLDVGLALSGLGATCSPGTVPSVSMSVPFSGAGTFTPWALTFFPYDQQSANPDGYYGFKFSTGSNTPRISHLGRYRGNRPYNGTFYPPNVQTHELWLFKYVDGTANDLAIASTSVDLSADPEPWNEQAYGKLSVPVTLEAGTTYYIVSQEFHNGDTWLWDDNTTLDTFTSDIGTHGGSVYKYTIDGNLTTRNPPNHTFGALNFKVVTGAEEGVQSTASPGDWAPGTIILDGVGGTGAVDSVAAQAGAAALSGAVGTTAVGTMEIPGQVAVTGEGGTASPGTTAPDNQIAISGIAATGATGVVGIGSASFAGVAATASLGDLSVANVTRKLRGNAATASLSPLLTPLTPPAVGDGSRMIRWVGHRVSVDGTDLVFGLSGPMTIDKSLDLGQQNTASFHVSDSAWPAAGNLWGNKPAEAYISLGTNPRQMTETKVFTGYTFQKRDTAGTPAETDLVCADASLAFTGIPVCYSLGAYSGKTRGQVITEVAATVGVTITDVPAGGIINKPVTLNNADLLQWIADFGLVENWYPHVDRDGNLSVRVLNQPATGWVADAEKGDFDLETLQETYPTRPPCRWYVTGSQAVQITATDDPDSPERITTTQVDEEQALYNPKCRKSYDPSGHSLPAAELMTVARITTEITTVGGDEVLRVTTTESFYNPATFDPNHDTWPATADYDDAYTDNSFHRDAVESLMETSKVTVTTTRDDVGTVLSQHTETMGWYSPQSRLTSVFPYSPEQIINGAASFIYGDGKAHITTVETYRVVSVIDTNYEYDATQGTLLRQVSTVQAFFAPESPCDTLVTYAGIGPYQGSLISVQVSNASVPTGSNIIGDPAPAPYAAWQNQFISFNIYYLWRRDFKWGESDWRSQEAETFQTVKRVDTRFAVVDGQVISTRETTEGFAKFGSGANANPELDVAPWMFADGQWYEGPETFETTGVKFTRYEQFGSTGHAKTTYSVNLVTGEVSIEAPTYSDGTMPLAPTIGSALRWARLPIVMEVEVAGCEFVDSKQNLDLPWAENEDDLTRAGLRAAQRATAIVREFDCAFNPLVEPGDGLLLTSIEHGINAEWHVITDAKATVDAGADMHIIAERWAPV